MFKPQIKRKGALMSKSVIEALDETPQRSAKSLARLKIQDEVFDNYDSVADNAKMISLIFSNMSRIYEVLPAAQKDALDPTERDLIEYTFAKFKTTNTRADLQLQTEGTLLIDKILDRQAQIGNILEG